MCSIPNVIPNGIYLPESLFVFDSLPNIVCTNPSSHLRSKSSIWLPVAKIRTHVEADGMYDGIYTHYWYI